MRFRARAVSAAVLAVLASSGVRAQDTREELLVMGTRLEETIPQQLQEYGNRLEVITGEQLRTGGFNDAAQALQMLVPGLYVAPKNGAFDYIQASLQGSRGNEILWLVDGVRINNRLYNSTSPLDTIPAHMIERIEVLKGGQGIFYGTQSVSGVVNVVTRGFSNETEARVGLGFDDNDGRHVNGFVRGAVGEGRYVLYASSDDAEGFQPYADEEIQPSTTDRDRGYDVKTFGARYGRQFGEDLTLSLQYQYTDAELDFAFPARSAGRTNDRAENLVSGKLDYALNDRVAVYLKAYYHDWDTRFSRVDTVVGSPGHTIVVSDREFWGFTDYGVNVMTKLSLQTGFDYFVGFEQQHYEGEDEVLLIARKTEEVNAVFAQARTTSDLFDSTNFALGVRYNESSAGQSATVWNFSGQHDFDNGLYLRVTGGTAFRLPDAYQLYAIDPFDTPGNPDLKPERSRNAEVGIGGRYSAGNRPVSWELIGFKRKVEDLITANSAGIATINSDSEVDVEGAEVIIGLSLSDAWSALLDYTHSRAEQDASGLQINNIPRDLAKLAIEYRPEARYGGALALVHTGDVFNTVSGVGRRGFGNYRVVDLSGFYHLDDSRRQRLGLRLENLFDEEYATSLGSARLDSAPAVAYAYRNLGTPRTVHLTYSYNFGGRTR